jgi:predicted regulator of Ras-like GTPase activity (Roadblock/LC7/MglB family)
MLSIFKKLFGAPAPKAAHVVPAPQQPLEPTVAMPSVEVAHLSLAVIVSHLPDELKALVRQAPSETATVALPVPTIMKQLATGCVKMSLASLHRQAHGVLGPLPGGDKRTVDVPLAEIFRHVSPHSLKRRPDQRAFFMPENGFNLFGNAENPYEISPSSPVEEPHADSTVLDLTPDAPRSLKMGEDSREPLTESVAPRAHDAPAPDFTPSSDEPITRQRVVAPPPGLGLTAPEPRKSAEPPARQEIPPVTLALGPVAESWPEDVRAALAAAIESGAHLALPSARLSEGLAKGRVAFTWGQICELIAPDAVSPGSIDESTSLMIPLRIVAPAFLAATKQSKTPRKVVHLDVSIPAPFTGNLRPRATPAPLAPPAPATPDAAPAPQDQMPPEAPSEAASPTPLEAPSESASETRSEMVLLPPPEMAPNPGPQAIDTAPAVRPAKLPETVGEVFGEPRKFDWTPAEIVMNTVRLAGVAGAVVALQEGLQVASSLPDGVKSDVVAAFLPQIFARLNQYAGEMRLGDVDDLLFTTHGAHCQIYRLGYVYFAVLGKPGESLPWHELRVISEELARQTSK